MSSPGFGGQIVALCLASLLVPALARAEGQPLQAVFAPSRVSVDGLPSEWEGAWAQLALTDGAAPSSEDISGKVLLSYDDDNLYVAAAIVDDRLVPGGDRLELVLGVPGGQVETFKLYPGAAGRAKARVGSRGRADVPGARIVEAATADGYSLEASIPWRAVPRAATVRLGFRAAVFVHDADASMRDEAVLGTAPSRSYAALPPVSLEPELALGAGLLRQRGLTAPPHFNRMANVAGDTMLERVLVYGPYLVVMGPRFLRGETYFFRDLAADSRKGDLLSLELMDLTGDGRDDLVVRKRVHGPDGSVEVVEVLSFAAGADAPDQIFAQEVALSLKEGSIRNAISVRPAGRASTLVVEAGVAESLEPSRFRQASSTGAPPVLLPWGTVASRTFGLRDGRFTVVSERKQPPRAPASPPRPPPIAPAAPRPAPVAAPRPSTGPDLAAVYAKYKQDRKASGAARLDLRANVSGDARQEHVLIHGADLVVFGPDHRGGRGYTALETPFASGADIAGVSFRDLTGDGHVEILVEGVLRAPLPDDLGPGEVRRLVVFAYAVRPGGFERIFSAELARQIGAKKVAARVEYGARRIVLSPGRAEGYDAASYPWAQRTDPSGEMEPLLLPWGGIARIELAYDGRRFVRRPP